MSWRASTGCSTCPGCVEVAELYARDVGRPAIDQEATVRLMLAGFLLGVVRDRRLMREAQVNLAIRWFAGFGLHERLPDRPSLTRIRQRCGAERFRRICERTVKACVSAGIVRGEVGHAHASLVRADVARESLAVRHVEAMAAANGDTEAVSEDGRRLRDSKKTGRSRRSASPTRTRP